jgi:hypothetical protein
LLGFFILKIITGSPEASGLFPLLETQQLMVFFILKIITGSPEASGLFPLLS